MNLPPPPPEDLFSDELSLLERQIARRADELAREMKEKHDDVTLWARAQAEILRQHEPPSRVADFRACIRSEDNVLRENVCR